MKNILFTLLVLILFGSATGFQLYIFTAIFVFGKVIWFDPSPEIRLAEFVMASGAFNVACLVFVLFMWKLGSKSRVKKVWI